MSASRIALLAWAALVLASASTPAFASDFGGPLATLLLGGGGFVLLLLGSGCAVVAAGREPLAESVSVLSIMYAIAAFFGAWFVPGALQDAQLTRSSLAIFYLACFVLAAAAFAWMRIRYAAAAPRS